MPGAKRVVEMAESAFRFAEVYATNKWRKLRERELLFKEIYQNRLARMERECTIESLVRS